MPEAPWSASIIIDAVYNISNFKLLNSELIQYLLKTYVFGK
jgi:hypothetical protein